MPAAGIGGPLVARYQLRLSQEAVAVGVDGGWLKAKIP
jgi:hypothetical protein